MEKMNFYTNLINAKDGTLIPIFFNEKPMFSKYNPNRDVEVFSNQFSELKEKTAVFVAGIGNGLHLERLLENENISLIFALEYNAEALDFCKNHLQKTSKIILCTLENFQQQILENYIPQIHGNFVYKGYKSWILAAEEYDANFSEKQIQKLILETLKNVSRDIATQSYFGKIWHTNILHNIYNFYLAQNSKLLQTPEDFDTSKTLAIIGASPNLENQIEELKKHPHDFYVISTDTAFPVLLQHKIIPNAVATLDGQSVSTRHFMQKIPENCLLIADFCSNPAIIKKFIKNKAKIAFTNTGHPLSSLFSFWLWEKTQTKSIYNVSAGNGTVLQLALDFGFSVGFTKYRLFGADFAYTQNKPYTKGTYFDYQFNSKGNKINSTENLYSELMYKGKLIVENSVITTENLKSYKEYLEKYLEIRHFSQNQDVKLQNQFLPKDFFQWYLKNLVNDEKNAKKTLLPLLAWINNYNKNSDNYNEAICFTKKVLQSYLTEE